MIDLATRRRVAAILPRLGSNHDGEVVAAAKALERTLGSGGNGLVDLADLIAPAPTPALKAPMRARDWKVVAQWCAQYGRGILTDPEQRFVDDLADRPPRQLTPRQEAWLQVLESRLSMRRAG